MAEATFSSLSSSSLKSSLQQTPPGNPVFVAFDDKYRCVVCNGIVREAVQTPCGHRACEQCIFQLLHGNPKKVKCPAGEETCSFLVLSEIHRDSGARREVRLLLVFCTFKTEGCEKILPWKDLQDHEIMCTYRLVECRFSSEGCKVVVIKRDVEIHQKQCPFRLESCKFCQQEIQNQLVQEHLEKTCPQYVIQCTYNCGTNPAPRVQMEQHSKECPRRPLKCKYHSIGCEFTGSEEEMEMHTRSETDSHIQLSVVRNTENALEVLHSREVTQTMDVKITELEHLLTKNLQVIEDLKGGVDTMKKAMKDIKLKVVAQTERLITVERKVENLADNEAHNKLSRDMMMIKETQNTLEGRINQLERAGPMGGSNGINGTLPAQIQQHERQLGIMDLRMAELDLRFQVMETASYNGVLMWKIRDYLRRKEDARTGKTISLYSQPFYTGRFGYKMCARVYLNGDGVGKGTHLSLFFVVQRGEYDALLPWPFKQKVTLMLLDQENGTRNLVDSFRPDITSSSFKRPTSEMNVASGCPLFVC
ncbi:TNF receptor-associated factor 3-like isoform X2 [Ostrea edulis]|uniref:TNF receptor-associated factor 3-like isoform X2 n=1 Tax=Ostrea edulis TaxID=37623 RepID=UPI0024AEE290|nr:TNF receptor-associated factor 3-like isoform X2 [Ostrea edulis]